MIFRIDLLNGSGLPKRSGCEGTAVMVASLGVPLIVFVAFVSVYMSNRISISSAAQEVGMYEGLLESKQFSEGLAEKQQLERKRAELFGCLGETADVLGWHEQWSEVLVEIVKGIEKGMILKNLEVDEDIVRKKISRGGKQVYVQVPRRRLRMTLSSVDEAGADSAVERFSDYIRSLEMLRGRLQDIAVSQRRDMVDGQQAASYEIECVFMDRM